MPLCFPMTTESFLQNKNEVRLASLCKFYARLNCSALIRIFPLAESLKDTVTPINGVTVSERFVFHLAFCSSYPEQQGYFPAMLHFPIKGIAIAYCLHANASQFVGQRRKKYVLKTSGSILECLSLSAPCLFSPSAMLSFTLR